MPTFTIWYKVDGLAIGHVDADDEAHALRLFDAGEFDFSHYAEGRES